MYAIPKLGFIYLSTLRYLPSIVSRWDYGRMPRSDARDTYCGDVSWASGTLGML